MVRPADSKTPFDGGFLASIRTPRGCARSVRDGLTPRGCTLIGAASLSLRLASFVIDSTTCAHVRLLGPCFKTGRVGPDFYSPLWASTGSSTPSFFITPKSEEKDNDSPGRRQVTTGQYCWKTTRSQLTGTEAPKRNSLTNAPCNRHPVGRGVLLGPPLADLGAANALLTNEQSLQSSRSLRSRGHATKCRERGLVRPSRAHPFNPLNGFTHS